METTFVPDPTPPPRISFIPRLSWWQTRNGNWHSNVVDTTYPERMVIFWNENTEKFHLSVFRPEEIPRASMYLLGKFDDVDAAKEFARQLVGDHEITTRERPLSPQEKRDRQL